MSTLKIKKFGKNQERKITKPIYALHLRDKENLLEVHNKTFKSLCVRERDGLDLELAKI